MKAVVMGTGGWGTALSLVLMVLVFVCTGIMNRFGGDEEVIV